MRVLTCKRFLFCLFLFGLMGIRCALRIVGDMIKELFGVKVSYIGTIKSTLASKMGMKGLTENVNDMHLQPWSEMTHGEEIFNTPLTPYLDQELLYNNNIHIDGSKVESTGFSYEHPKLELATIKEVLQAYADMKLFPSKLLA